VAAHSPSRRLLMRMAARELLRVAAHCPSRHWLVWQSSLLVLELTGVGPTPASSATAIATSSTVRPASAIGTPTTATAVESIVVAVKGRAAVSALVTTATTRWGEVVTPTLSSKPRIESWVEARVIARRSSPTSTAKVSARSLSRHGRPSPHYVHERT
jgi:hypothetical protein